MDGVEADRVQVVDGRAQADGRHDRRRAGFELGRQLGRLEAVERHAADHAAAAQKRRHRFEQFAAAVEHADARGPEHLVAAEGQEIGAQRLHVGRQVRHALGRVDQHHARRRRAPGAMISASGLIVPSTFETAATATSLRALRRAARRAASSRSRPSSVIGSKRTHGAGARGQLLPGDDVRVVLHLGEQDFVARPAGWRRPNCGPRG